MKIDYPAFALKTSIVFILFAILPLLQALAASIVLILIY